MTFTYNYSFFDCEGRTIGGGRLEWKYTHYDDAVRSFMYDLCWTELPKAEFVHRFKEAMDKFDISSQSFSNLVGALGIIVNDHGWDSAIIIASGRD